MLFRSLYGQGKFPDVVATAGLHTTVIRDDGVSLRAFATPLLSNQIVADARLIVALDERSMHRTLAEFRFALVTATLLSVLSAALLGAWVTRRGLAPMRRLVDQASRMHPGDLARRLDTGQLPDELRELGFAFNGVLDRLEFSYKQMEAFNSDVAHELRSH